jgi:hypothetical protein
MTIVTHRYGTKLEETIEQHFERLLEGQNDGIAENARDIADNTKQSLGRLVRLLAEKQILDADDVLIISDGYSTELPYFSK